MVMTISYMRVNNVHARIKNVRQSPLLEIMPMLQMIRCLLQSCKRPTSSAETRPEPENVSPNLTQTRKLI